MIALRSAHVRELVAYGVLAGLGVMAVVSGIQYGLRDGNGVAGPGMLPAASGALIVVLSVTIPLRSLRARRSPQKADAASAQIESAPARPGGGVRAWIVVAVMVAAVLLVPVVGLLIALGVLVFVMATLVERRRPAIALAVSVTSVAVLYLIFDMLLGVPLPVGLLSTGG